MGLYLGSSESLKFNFKDGKFSLIIPSFPYDTTSVLGVGKLGHMILIGENSYDTTSVLGVGKLGHMILI